MPWYKAGTVSVTQNSNAVIGSNTSFISSSRVGDGFRGPDGGWYEVVNIASDTALSIYPAYQGVTAGAGVYMLAPLQGYVKEAADQLRTLVNKFGSLAAAASINALAAVTGGANKLAYFTAPDAMATTDFPAQARSLLAANSQSAQRSALGLNTAAVAPILGSVSQSNGVPTGSIIETGSNTNGTYIRWADGTQICHRRYGVGLTVGAAIGSMFYSGAISPVSFAVGFSSLPIIEMTLEDTAAVSWLAAGGQVTTLGTPTIYIVSPQSSSSARTYFIDIVAIGRWFG
ncbi:hypothetical protein AO278_22560 [Pseudomonas syringae pv. syringae]|uniref:phage tail protein n=1 Tax=Pseudomonas syringae TaxID=317 RepID=UPI000C12B9BE|nr:phage tail protein [Pseudomonas syringae]PHX25791.1 hypothetical protein AO278_22560 [Pseudomonas syringae pv. syringae]